MKPILSLKSVFIAGIASATISSAQTVLVPEDFATIQIAIDNSSPGSVIQVGPGIRLVNLVVDKAVTIIGTDQTLSKLRPLTSAEPVISIQSDSVTLENLVVERGSVGIMASDSDQVSLVGLRVRDHSGVGVSFENCDFINVNGSRSFNNAGIGFLQVGGLQSNFTDVRAFRNQSGIVIESATEPNLTRCAVNINAENGIEISSSAGATLMTNSCFGNNLIGLSVSDSTDVETVGNFLGSNMIGYDLLATSGNVSRNRIIENSSDGMRSRGSSNITFARNSIIDNGGNGIDWQGSNSSFSENVVRNNGEFGFSVEGDNNTFEENFSRDNAIGYGIWGDSNFLRANKASQNQGEGFFVSQGQNNLLSNNGAESNEGLGFHLDAQVGTMVSSTSTVRNGEDGLFLDPSSSNIMVDSGFAGLNGGFGLVDQGVSNTFYQNAVWQQ